MATSSRHRRLRRRPHGQWPIAHTLAGARSLIADFARWQLSEAMVCAGAVPVLISAGDRDAMVPVAEVTKLFSALGPKLGAVAILPGTPHALQHLPLECFAHLVRCFLVSAPGKGRHK